MTSSSRAEICEPVSSRGGIAVSTALLVGIEWHHHIAVDEHSQWSHSAGRDPMHHQTDRVMRGMIRDDTFAAGARVGFRPGPPFGPYTEDALRRCYAKSRALGLGRKANAAHGSPTSPSNRRRRGRELE